MVVLFHASFSFEIKLSTLINVDSWELKEKVHYYTLFIYFLSDKCNWDHKTQNTFSLSLSLSFFFSFLLCLVGLLSNSNLSFMDWSGSRLFLFTAFLILAASIGATLADTTVSGTVFCDQCKDGQLSLSDYPVSGEWDPLPLN